MKKLTIISMLIFAFAAMMCIPRTANAQQDPEGFELMVPGLDLAQEWDLPSDLGKMVGQDEDMAFFPYIGVEKPRYINQLFMISPATLTENYLSDGSMVTIEAEAIADSFSMIFAPRTLVNLTYYKFDVETRTATSNDVSVFKTMSYGIKHRFRISKNPIASGIAEYRFIDNNYYDMSYYSVAMSAPFGKRVTGTLGFGYLDAQESESEGDLIAGMRVTISHSLQAYALYSGVDPIKHMYNNHILNTSTSVGSVYCQDCSKENFAAGISLRIGSNIALNLYSYDITDLSVPAGALYYVIKD